MRRHCPRRENSLHSPHAESLRRRRTQRRGKNDYVRRFLPQEMRCREFVNADLIAAGLSPFNPDDAAFDAGRIMLKRLRDLTARKEDFSFETTLSGYGYVPFLGEMRAAGYRIRLDFLWIPNLDITR